ncbi:uncharacterized protein LOC135950606 [Calliphora vicina]|uniref:uncharacterized protein LOC135950606 n=1 Tax=Calliphora vicina TaxID=7373 RepID=UPI00325B703F
MLVTPLNRFIRASDALIAFEANFNDFPEDIHNVYTLEVQSAEIKLLWEKVKTTYEACLDFLENSDTEPSDVDVAASKYQVTYVAYMKCLGSINEKVSKFKSVPNASDSPVVNSDSGHTLTLPPCDVDAFGGDYDSWPAFRDLFTAIYIKSSRLSNVERLCHLIRKTEGEAKDIVLKSPLSNEGFEVAWRDLKIAYENPRMKLVPDLRP